MSLDIKNALNYPLKDKSWKIKVFIGGLLMIAQVFGQILSDNSKEIAKYMKALPASEFAQILPFIIPATLILAVVIVVTSLFTGGYFAKNINGRIFRADNDLPNWEDWKSLFFIGLKTLGGTVVYSVLFLLIGLIPFALLFFFKTNPFVIAVLAVFCLVSLVFTLSLVIAISSMAFNTDLKFASFFNFKLMKNLLKNNLAEFFIVVLLSLALGVVFSIVSAILGLTIIGIILVPFIMFYQFLIVGDLNAQFIRNSLDKQKA